MSDKIGVILKAQKHEYSMQQQSRRKALRHQVGGGAVRHSVDDAGAVGRACGGCRCWARTTIRLLAEQNRIRKEPVLAPRGKLFDRESRLVVDNYPSVSCFLVREQNRNVDADLPLIARV